MPAYHVVTNRTTKPVDPPTMGDDVDEQVANRGWR